MYAIIKVLLAVYEPSIQALKRQQYDAALPFAFKAELSSRILPVTHSRLT